MKCSDARQRLPELLYGDLGPQETSAIQEHLHGCPDCRREALGLERLRQTLDTLPVPPVVVSLPQLYQAAARRQALRLKRWRRAAQALCGIAALLLLVFLLRIELSVDAQQFTLRWGKSPEPPPAAASPSTDSVATAVQPLSPEVEEHIQLQARLIQALAADVDSRESTQQQQIDRLQERLDVLQAQGNARWSDTERTLAALYVARFGSSQKGNQP